MERLNVFWESDQVGVLEASGSRDMVFRYTASYLDSEVPRPISLSLPLQAEAHGPERSRAWFANLLPEGDVRVHLARRLGISERNEFALLAAVGGECAGALSLLPPPETPDVSGGLIPMDWDALEKDIAARPRPSLMALMMREGTLRLSLAGAQDKLPVRYLDGQLSLPNGSAASTHLLKVSAGDFPDLVQNEFYCMSLARAAQLWVPRVELAPTGTAILIVERYDRLQQMDGSIRRIHQEDFCQALGIPPERKYENEGGPALNQMFEVVARGSASPLPDKRDLLRWVVFNYLIGNADTHAKNVSLLWNRLDRSRRPRLAPFYDLVCTAVYEDLSPRFAQKIGGEYRPRFLGRRHWDRLAESLGIKPHYLVKTGMELCNAVEPAAPALVKRIGAQHGGLDTLAGVAAVIRERIERLRSCAAGS